MIENFNEDGIIAFATVQGALEAVAKGRSVANKRGGTMYKYANIADVIAAVRQPLTENGFVFTHTTVPVSGPDGSPLPDLVRMRCVIIHRTGMTVTSEATSHVQNIDPQGIGSALTYLRRYTLLGALGLLAGYFYAPLVAVASGGLCLLMVLGVATRVRVGDPFVEALPALTLGLVNALVFALAIVGARAFQSGGD